MLNLLPKIKYDFTIKNETNGKILVLPDLLTRINLTSTSDYSELVEDYYISEDLTIDIVAYNLYGNMDYHWTIMMVNNKFDYINDYPIKSSLLLDYVKNKYGPNNVFSVHHYEDKKGNIVDKYYHDYEETINVNVGTNNTYPIWMQSISNVQLKKAEAREVSNYEYEEKANDKKRLIKVIKKNYITDFVYKFYEKMKEIE